MEGEREEQRNYCGHRESRRREKEELGAIIALPRESRISLKNE